MGLAGVIAVLDWWAVATHRRDIERWAKPAVMVFLIAAAVLIPAESDWIRWWIVIGLAFGLVGDVLLFYDRFIPGAAAFHHHATDEITFRHHGIEHAIHPRDGGGDRHHARVHAR